MLKVRGCHSEEDNWCHSCCGASNSEVRIKLETNESSVVLCEDCFVNMFTMFQNLMENGVAQVLNYKPIMEAMEEDWFKTHERSEEFPF